MVIPDRMREITDKENFIPDPTPPVPGQEWAVVCIAGRYYDQSGPWYELLEYLEDMDKGDYCWVREDEGHKRGKPVRPKDRRLCELVARIQEDKEFMQSGPLLDVQAIYFDAAYPDEQGANNGADCIDSGGLQFKLIKAKARTWGAIPAQKDGTGKRYDKIDARLNEVMGGMQLGAEEADDFIRNTRKERHMQNIRMNRIRKTLARKAGVSEDELTLEHRLKFEEEYSKGIWSEPAGGEAGETHEVDTTKFKKASWELISQHFTDEDVRFVENDLEYAAEQSMQGVYVDDRDHTLPLESAAQDLVIPDSITPQTKTPLDLDRGDGNETKNPGKEPEKEQRKKPVGKYISISRKDLSELRKTKGLGSQPDGSKA
jgi:hypothetical protein